MTAARRLVPVADQVTLSPQEAADLLGGIGRSKVYELINAGELPTLTLYSGGGVRIARSDLDAYVLRRKQESQQALNLHLNFSNTAQKRA